ncbi:MAG: hypothetical protein ACI4WS_05970 [Oscillospiraceae bacterium]
MQNRNLRNRISRYLLVIGGTSIGSALTRSKMAGIFDTGDFIAFLIGIVAFIISLLIEDEGRCV